MSWHLAAAPAGVITPERINARARKAGNAIALMVALFLLPLIFNQVGAKWLSVRLLRIGLRVHWSLIALGMLLVMMLAVGVLGRKIANRTLIKCPSCQQAIGSREAGVVIASGNCPNCGQQIMGRYETMNH